MFLALLALSLWATALQAASASDLAVFGALKQADTGLAHFAQMQRTGVTGDFDLVIVIGSAKPFPPKQDGWTWWSEERKIGLFLQEKARPERVYSLDVK